MKAIIIGAGTGKRIGEFEAQSPKSSLVINDKTILENQLEILRKNNINEIVMITGPYSEKFTLPDISYVHDSNYSEHDILGSLMVAKEHICGNTMILYSDILFDDSILKSILKSTSDISIAVDLEWENAYLNRTEHPKSEAENVLFDANGKISKIQKNISNSDNKIGEFLGIIKLSTNGSKKFLSKINELQSLHKEKFHTATSLNKAYLTDLIQELIDSNIDVSPAFVSGKWCEIDTLQDLTRAKNLF